MINLQLPNEKEELLLEYKKRKIFVFSALVLFALIISIVLIGTLYTIIKIDKSSSAESLGVIKNEDQVNKFNDFEKTLKDTSELVSLIKTNQVKGELTSDLVKEIVSLRSTGIKINAINISKELDGVSRVELKGVSLTRKSLTSFLDILKKQPRFTEVDSPIANLIKDVNSDFTVSFKVGLNK